MLFLTVAMMAISSVSVFAHTPQPDSTVANAGQVAVASSEVFYNTATPDSRLLLARSNYRVVASMVRMYTWGANEEFSHGMVQATAPRFNARAEVWRSGAIVAPGWNTPNPAGSDIARASSTATFRNNANIPRIFFNW